MMASPPYSKETNRTGRSPAGSRDLCPLTAPPDANLGYFLSVKPNGPFQKNHGFQYLPGYDPPPGALGDEPSSSRANGCPEPHEGSPREPSTGDSKPF